MQSSNTPSKIPLPFASGVDALKNTIPENSASAPNPNNASYQLGFPPITMLPIESGGLPFYGQDMNGILYALSSAARWANAGGSYKYDATFANDTNVGGYPKGALLIKDGLGGFWFNTVENNTSNPDTGGAGWVDLSSILTNIPTETSIAGLRTRPKTGPAFCFVSGYYASGDGGGGMFYYDSADVTSSDNGGTIIVASDGGRWKLIHDGSVTVEQFGAVGSISDHTSAINAAFSSGIPSVVCNGSYVCGQLTVTNSVKKLTGNGTIKLKNNAGAVHLLDITSANGLSIEGITFDGNKANQSGFTQGSRSSFISVVIEPGCIDVVIRNCSFVNAYGGACLANNGLRTLIVGNKFLDAGVTSFDGTCDAMYHGTTASLTKVLFNNINNCSDYGSGTDTSDITIAYNYIINCSAGIGSMTRGSTQNHRIFGNFIAGCTKSIDYYNQSGSSNVFKNIRIQDNVIWGQTGTNGMISFANNVPGQTLGTGIKISGNICDTGANAAAGIFVHGQSGYETSGVVIENNEIIGDGATQSTKPAIDIEYCSRFVCRNNVIRGCDMGIYVAYSTGESYGQTWANLVRNAYSEIKASTLYNLKEYFHDIPAGQWAMMVTTGSDVTCDITATNCGRVVYLYDNSGALAASTVRVNSYSRGSTANGYDFYVSSTNDQTLMFGSEPISYSGSISYNTRQNTWAIGAAPTAGTWPTGAKAYVQAFASGSPKGWVCTAGGTPGTWTSLGNL